MRLSTLPAVLAMLAMLLAGALPASAADAPGSGASATLDRIKRTGIIRLAYREGAAPFSFKDRGGAIRGYSVELCNRVAKAIEKDLGLAGLRVEWLPVTAATRLEAIAGGRADVECGTTSITLTRLRTVDFSVPIFVDGGTVLVDTRSRLARLADFKGKRVAVIAGTTTERALKRSLEQIDVAATLVAVKDGEAGMALLVQGKVDGYAGDRIVLDGLRSAAPDPARIGFIAGDFSYEPYALVVRRTDPDFRLAVNRALVDVYRSGEIDGIFQSWLGALGEPGLLLHSMFYLNTLPE
jgi:polar amino acid transport system substrate-binding protein/glutamate/aspartate transport system substrate-binding protein